MIRNIKTKPTTKKTRIKSFKQFLKDREKEKELAAASSTGHEPAQGSDEINSNQSGAIPLQVDTLVS